MSFVSFGHRPGERRPGPSSEPGSKPVTLALSGRLEAYVSQLGAQLREGHAVRQRAALSVPGPSNAQETHCLRSWIFVLQTLGLLGVGPF